ncbi:MAG: hypothetical protein CME63_10830 [Halobacteriovoraceae bacterium]|nr:hypothetical protein [Halobacteriovoraceae bacterium]|tara:strand:- start:136980 stop:138398 length:1419 start_codon:yes stop_codon:yes gene_type:complete
MKKENLLSLLSFLLLFFFSSCSHLHYGDSSKKRNPAGLSSDHFLEKFRIESARYILSFEPKKYGSFEELSSEEKERELYALMGQIDTNQVRPIPSQLTGKEKGYKDIFNLSSVSQIPYDQWKQMKEEVSAAYENGEYVFKKDAYFYTLSGLKFTERILDHRIFFQVKRYAPHLDFEKLAKSLLNRKTYFPLSQDSGIILPTGIYVMERHLSPLLDDFTRQVGRHASAEDILNSSVKGKGLSFSNGLESYANLKYQAFLYDEAIDNPHYACETRFYYRSLSRRSEAKEFIETLLEHKSKLMDILELTNNEYDELMQLSLGILAVESKMGASLKYKIKEDIRIGKLNLGQLAIKLLKRLKGRNDENSRGLTQIKDIGPFLKDTEYAYLEDSDLDDPENAALATMFVLKEKLGYLRHFANRHSNITEDNWADYLYYFYQGASSQITKGLATPPLNLRIQRILEVKENSMIFRNCR